MIKQRKNASPPIRIECVICSKAIFKRPSDIKLGRGKYCSLKCRGIGYVGENNPKWRGGRIKNGGYVYIYKPNHPDATLAGYVCEHRLVMEEHLNRLINKNEHVHHINEKRDDNRIENLIVLTHKEHLSIHLKGKKQSPEHIQKRFANRTYDVSKRERDSSGRFK